MKNLVDIANQFGITLKTCGEGDTFKSIGADTSGCLTIDCYERAWNIKLKVPKKRPARHECNCYLHGDIGRMIHAVIFAVIVMLIQISMLYASTEITIILNPHYWLDI